MQAFFANFEPKDWVNFGLALAGIILSLLFGVFQIHRDRKRLSIVLYRSTPESGGRLAISNSGHRPVTVTDIYFRAQMKNKDGEWVGGIDRHETPGLIHTEQGSDLLPKLLKDGDRLAVVLPETVFEIIKDPLYPIFVMVKDGDNKSHTQYQLGDNWPRRPRKGPKIVWR